MAAYQRFILLFTPGSSEKGREHFATDFIYLLFAGPYYVVPTVLWISQKRDKNLYAL